MELETLTQTEAEKDASTAPAEALETEATETAKEATESEDSKEAVSQDGEESEEQAEAKPKKIGGYKAKLLKERAKSEFLEQRLRELEAKVPVKADVALEKPDPSKYENQADYIEALTDYKVAVFKKDLESQKAKEGEQTKEKQTFESHLDRVNKFRKETPDFDKVIQNFEEENEDAELSEPLKKLIVKREVGPAVLYELAKNPDLFEELNSLDAVEAAIEFGKLEAKLSKPKQQQPKKIASPPPKPISGTKQQISQDPFEEGISFAEYDRRMSALEQKRAQKRA